MNGKDIFLGLRYVESEFIEEAEFGKFSTKASREAVETETYAKRKSFRRPFLIAAMVALMLLLVGCAVVYVLNMQNLKVGDQIETKPVIGTDGMHILGYEAVNQQVLTLAGLKGSAGYQAAMEWFEFKQEYDPDHTIQMSVWGEEKDFPAAYDAYNIYTQEMKDKLDEIMDTYGLKPAGAALEFRTLKNMCAALGVERVQTTANDVTVMVDSGGCRENGNFSLNLNFVLPDEPEAETDTTWGVLRWNRKDCFSEDLFAIEDTGDWQEWNYTTASGNEVLIIRSPSDWRGWIICEREEAVLSLQIEARQDLGNNDGEKTWWDYLYMTDRQMEMVADAVDFGIQPRVATQEDVDNQPAASNASTQDGYTVELKSVETDGQIAYITLGITAPEGTIISRTTKEGREDDVYHINTTNFDRLTPALGDVSSGSYPMNPKEDGDGLDNTQDFVIEAEFSMQDGSKPFMPGSVWNLRLEDLIHDYEVLAEGEWEWEITFGDENGDFREIEFVEEPITMSAITGWYADGTDAFDDVEVTSFTLRSMSATIKHNWEAGSVDFTRYDMPMYAVMADGSRVKIQSSGGTTGETRCIMETPIDVEQVEHVLLPDGRKLEAPQ